MKLRTAPLRVLDDGDRDEALALLDADPVTNVFVASRVRTAGLHPGRLGAQIWGFGPRGGLSAMCYAGANLVPVPREPGTEAIQAFAGRARRQGRRCSSIVGPSSAVESLWEHLSPAWGPPRAIRHRQPVMVARSAPRVLPDPGVRRARPDEFGILLPACVEMFTEEVGISPYGADGGILYRARVAELIRMGRSFVRIEDGKVVFKAEIGAVTPHACQVQGVWVPPELRGRGYGVAGMAAVVGEALRSIAPAVTLYVNDFNTVARAVYDRVGFTETSEFTTVLF